MRIELVDLVVEVGVGVDERHVDDVEQQDEEHEDAADPVPHEGPLARLALVDDLARPDLGGFGCPGRHQRLRNQRSPHIVEPAT